MYDKWLQKQEIKKGDDNVLKFIKDMLLGVTPTNIHSQIDELGKRSMIIITN